MWNTLWESGRVFAANGIILHYYSCSFKWTGRHLPQKGANKRKNSLKNSNGQDMRNMFVWCDASHSPSATLLFWSVWYKAAAQFPKRSCSAILCSSLQQKRHIISAQFLLILFISWIYNMLADCVMNSWVSEAFFGAADVRWNELIRFSMAICHIFVCFCS